MCSLSVFCRVRASPSLLLHTYEKLQSRFVLLRLRGSGSVVVAVLCAAIRRKPTNSANVVPAFVQVQRMNWAAG